MLSNSFKWKHFVGEIILLNVRRYLKYGSVAKIILLLFYAITIAFCIIIDLFMAYKYPICDVFHWFCKIARFFATEPYLLYYCFTFNIH